MKREEKKLHFEEYELINLQTLYNNDENGVTVNLVAYIGAVSIPFYVQKQMKGK